MYFLYHHKTDTTTALPRHTIAGYRFSTKDAAITTISISETGSAAAEVCSMLATAGSDVDSYINEWIDRHILKRDVHKTYNLSRGE